MSNQNQSLMQRIYARMRSMNLVVEFPVLKAARERMGLPPVDSAIELKPGEKMPSPK